MYCQDRVIRKLSRHIGGNHINYYSLDGKTTMETDWINIIAKFLVTGRHEAGLPAGFRCQESVHSGGASDVFRSQPSIEHLLLTEQPQNITVHARPRIVHFWKQFPVFETLFLPTTDLESGRLSSRIRFLKF